VEGGGVVEVEDVEPTLDAPQPESHTAKQNIKGNNIAVNWYSLHLFICLQSLHLAGIQID
jgi:hypothetical protein